MHELNRIGGPLFLVVLLWLPLSSHAARPLTFAEPRSGARVQHYQVSLAGEEGAKLEFTVPDDCSQLTSEEIQSGRRNGTVVERGMWAKVARDCHYHSLVSRFPRPAQNNFLAGIDLMNLTFDDLPVGMPCALPGVSCETPLPAGGPPPSAADCRIRGGVFRGHVFFDGDRIWCRQDPAGSGFRIVSVVYSDANGDDIQDAVLRVVSLGGGFKHTPQHFVVTRFSADDRLQMPQSDIR